MLGPALIHLLHTITKIPEGERTDEQQRQFAELQEIFVCEPKHVREIYETLRVNNAMRATLSTRSIMHLGQMEELRTALPYWQFFGRTEPYGASSPYDASPGPTRDAAPMGERLYDTSGSPGKCKKCGQYFPVNSQPVD